MLGRRIAGALAGALMLATGVAAPAGAITLAPAPGTAAGKTQPGQVIAGGFNASGLLGFGDTAQRETPTPVPGLSDVVAAATGYDHSLLLRADGTVWAAGDNSHGQLGDNSTTQRLSPVQVPSISNIVAVAAGYEWSLALRNDGVLFAWGANNHGQLGTGNTTEQHAPVQSGITTITAIAAGLNHGLALTANGRVMAWGANDAGQVGDGTTGTDRLSPVQVIPAGSTVASVAAGTASSYALRSDGTVQDWGSNAAGQLGDGTGAPKTAPQVVPALSNIVSVSAGYDHVLFVTSTGRVRAAGNNSQGQLGDNAAESNTTTVTPVQVSGISTAVRATASGFHSFAILADGSVRSWGANGTGELGDGSTSQRNTPVTYAAPGPVAALASGVHNQATLAILATPAMTKPSAPSFNLQGTGTTSPPRSLTFTSAGTLPLTISRIDVVGTGGDQYALEGDGCSGQTLAPGQTCTVGLLFAPTRPGGSNANLRITSNASPAVDTLAISGLAMAPLPAPALGAGAARFAFGRNQVGQLGLGTIVQPPSPTPAPASDGSFVQVSEALTHGVGLRPDGTVWTWGTNDVGQLGNGTQNGSLTPAQVPVLSGMTAVAAGYGFTLAMRSDGTVWAWGNNNVGQVGANSTASFWTTPRQVAGITNAVAIAAGREHAIALLADGTVRTWGGNSQAQLGDGTTVFKKGPVSVPGTSGVTAIAAGDFFSLTLLGNGMVQGWGENDDGELADGTFTSPRFAPTQALTTQPVKAIAAGGYHTVALLYDGTVRTWGYNAYGALGDNTTTKRSQPVTLFGNPSGFTAVAAGEYDTLALKLDGTAWAWGYDAYGQLGDGGTTNQLVPVQSTVLGHGAAAVASGPTSHSTSVLVQPHVTLSTTKVTFDAAGAGTTSVSKPVTVTNDGAAPLVIGTVDIYGSDGDEFTKAGDGCSGRTLQWGASCTVDVRYKPVINHTGTSLATLRILSNSPTSPDTVVLDPPPPAGADATSQTTAPVAARTRQSAAATSCTLRRTAHGGRLTCTRPASSVLLGIHATLAAGGRTFKVGGGRVTKAHVRFTVTSKRRLPKGTYTVFVLVPGSGVTHTTIRLR